jgi:hypothetical protein
MEKYKRNYAKWDDFTNKYPALARIMNLHNIQEFTFIGNSRIYFTKNGAAWNLDLPGLLSKADLQKYFTLLTKHTIKKYTLIKHIEFASLSTSNKAIVNILAKLTNNKFIFEMDSENRTTIYIGDVPVNASNYRLNNWFTPTEIGKYVVPVVDGDVLQKCQVSDGLVDNSVQVKTQVNLALLNWLLNKAGYTSVLSAQRSFNTERQTEISTIEKQINDLQAKLSKLRS